MTEQQLADLRATRKVLAIDAASTAGGRGWIHPRFQFDSSGQPYAEIALVLDGFSDVDPIAICDWFAEPNPLLDGHPPMKFWLTDRTRVVRASRYLLRHQLLRRGPFRMHRRRPIAQARFDRLCQIVFREWLQDDPSR